MRRPISILLISTLFAAGCEQSLQPADLVLINGGIYTVDTNRAWAEAAAIRDGEIIAVGSNEIIAELIGGDTRTVDLQGRMALPGFHDSHIHPLEGAYEQVHCDLSSADSIEEIGATLRNCEFAAEDEWFNAVGLDLGLFGLTGPDKSLLEGVSPGSYLFIDTVDGHAALVNDKALALAGIDADTAEPPDGVIERHEGGREPNGTVRETARDLIDVLRPPRSLDVSIPAMRGAIGLINSLGITSVVDLWGGEHEYQIYKTLDNAGELSLRVANALIDEGVFEKHSGEDFERMLAVRKDYESALINNNAIKIMIDGVFEGETGAVLEPYASVDHHGVLNHTREDLYARVLQYYDMGLQLHFHAIGDAAVRRGLDALEYARKNGATEHLNRRHSLSHLGLIDPADMPRFAEVNAAASFTAVWGFSSEWTVNLEIPTLGRERVARMYPIRSTHGAGAVIVGGSDWNYGALDPLLSIETGVTRSDPYGPSDFEQYTSETVDLSLMIDAYTINGAWLKHTDDVNGSIEAGKLADIIVLDRNLFDIDSSEINEARVDLTIFDGRVVYERSNDAGE